MGRPTSLVAVAAILVLSAASTECLGAGGRAVEWGAPPDGGSSRAVPSTVWFQGLLADAGTGDPVNATSARSTLVAGIYSTRPGFLGSERDWDRLAGTGDGERESCSLEDMAAEFNEVPVAVVGIVPCKVTAENGAISPGDLPVTSSIPGLAMRDGAPAAGTIVGKALGSLAAGEGVLDVLVTLQ